MYDGKSKERRGIRRVHFVITCQQELKQDILVI